jgi:hypothetical protein
MGDLIMALHPKHPSDQLSIPGSLLRGLRRALEDGYEPQELADKLGPLIDVMAGDIRRQREETRMLEEAEQRARPAATRKFFRGVREDSSIFDEIEEEGDDESA